MSYLGNLNGPRESEILNRMGAGFFGCSPAGLEEDISYHQYAEAREEVVPIHVDDQGRPYIEFSSPEPGKTQRFDFESYGYFFNGEIRTYSDIEKTRWNAGLNNI